MDAPAPPAAAVLAQQQGQPVQQQGLPGLAINVGAAVAARGAQQVHAHSHFCHRYYYSTTCTQQPFWNLDFRIKARG